MHFLGMPGRGLGGVKAGRTRGKILNILVILGRDPQSPGDGTFLASLRAQGPLKSQDGRARPSRVKMLKLTLTSF